MSDLPSPTRRQFIQISATSLGGMLIGVQFSCDGTEWGSLDWQNHRIGYFIEIDTDNHITLHVPKPEIGQGVHTSLAMLIAEELEVDFASISVEQLPVRLVQLQSGSGYRWLHGSQDVGGSTSITDTWQLMRQAGAEARRRFIRAASATWNVDEAGLEARDARIIRKADGAVLTYGELAALAASLPEMAEPAPLKEPGDFKLIGTPQKTVSADRIVTGQMEYGIDAEIPGMLHAVVERAPRLGAKLVSFDSSRALDIPGVRHVVALEGPEPLGDLTFEPIADGVAVVAESHWAALKGREALTIEWTHGPMRGVSTDSLNERIRDLMKEKGQVLRDDGNVEVALEQAAHSVEAIYQLPLVSHATMEPQGCIAHVRGDGCDIIAPMQDCSDAVRLVAERTGFSLEQINARVTRSGGGFGRRLDEDYVAEAVDISKAVGAPVHVQWTREDDIRNDFYRPLARHHLKVGLDDRGDVTAWHHKLATTARYFRRRGVEPENYYIPEMWLDDFPAQIVPNMRVEYFFVETAIPTGPWRAPGHTANVFAVQSMLDEIAYDLGEDPLALRLRLLGVPREIPYGQHGGPIFDTGRLSDVLEIAAANAGWGESLPAGYGRGIAGHFTFGSYIAHVINVHVTVGGELEILKVTGAVDCGIPVNPNGVRAQMEGSINDGLSTALGQKITLRDGRVVEGNFDTYKMMRIGMAPPEIDVHVVRSIKDPTGMGEPGIPPVAPALTNAIFQATGKRIRSLPVETQYL